VSLGWVSRTICSFTTLDFQRTMISAHATQASRIVSCWSRKMAKVAHKVDLDYWFIQRLLSLMFGQERRSIWERLATNVAYSIHFWHNSNFQDCSIISSTFLCKLFQNLQVSCGDTHIIRTFSDYSRTLAFILWIDPSHHERWRSQRIARMPSKENKQNY